MISFLYSLTTLGWVPFVQPLPVHDYWLVLLLPLAFGVALVYKALKLPDLDDLLGQSLRTAGLIILFMILAAALLWVFF
jgi:hypothetical protein